MTVREFESDIVGCAKFHIMCNDPASPVRFEQSFDKVIVGPEIAPFIHFYNGELGGDMMCLHGVTDIDKIKFGECYIYELCCDDGIVFDIVRE